MKHVSKNSFQHRTQSARALMFCCFVALLVSGAHGCGEEESSEETQASSSTDSATISNVLSMSRVYKTKEEAPKCSEEEKRKLIYTLDTGRFLYCPESVYDDYVQLAIPDNNSILSSLTESCQNGQVVKMVISGDTKEWKCQDDQDLLGGIKCSADGQIPNFSGGKWQCVAAGQDKLSMLSCQQNQIPKVNANGDWACGQDQSSASIQGIANLQQCGNTGYARHNGTNWVFHCPQRPDGLKIGSSAAEAQTFRTANNTTTKFSADAELGDLGISDANLEVVYSIVGGKDAKHFKVDSTNNKLKFKIDTDVRLDPYYVAIEAQDNIDGLKTTKIFAITVSKGQ